MAAHSGSPPYLDFVRNYFCTLLRRGGGTREVVSRTEPCGLQLLVNVSECKMFGIYLFIVYYISVQRGLKSLKKYGSRRPSPLQTMSATHLLFWVDGFPDFFILATGYQFYPDVLYLHWILAKETGLVWHFRYFYLITILHQCFLCCQHALNSFTSVCVIVYC